jgi:DNA polymerase III delta prime subunit
MNPMYTELLTYVAKKTTDIVFAKVSDTGFVKNTEYIPDVEERLSTHLKMVNKWSSRYTTVGLGIPKQVDTETIDLALHTTPRRYRGNAKMTGQITEADMLLDDASYVILGDPGSGKTTTIKRIARTLLCREPCSSDDFLQYPILVELRTLKPNESLFSRLSDIFALPVQRGLDPSEVIGESRPSKDKQRRQKRKTGDVDNHYEIRAINHKVSEVLAQLLSETHAALLIDGLDELSYRKKDSVQQELRELELQLSSCKVFLTCRTGDYRKHLESFNVVELLPLDQDQIATIARLWIKNVSEFLKSLAATPYSDIVDRPLILTFLLYLFKATGELPPRPALIYRQVVYRLLKEWDENRGIVRQSQYSCFDPDRKIDFLSELSYLLTYQIKSKSFDLPQFAHVYDKLKDGFGLPANEAELVAGEIETHTGLLFASGLGTIEFSHLSIQEYLCANYLVTSPHPDLLCEYFKEYPAPLAVACSLSSDPSRFFAEIVKRHLLEEFRDKPFGDVDPSGQLRLPFELDALDSFLARIIIENPNFRLNIDFGFTVLCLFAANRQNFLDRSLFDFMLLHGVLSSVREALLSNDIRVVAVRDDLFALSIDEWFSSLYFQVQPPWQVMAFELAQLNPKYIGEHLRRIERKIEAQKKAKKKSGRSMHLPDFPLVFIPSKLAKQLDDVKIVELDMESEFAKRLKHAREAKDKRAVRRKPWRI